MLRAVSFLASHHERSIKTPDMAPKNVLKRVEERWPLYLTAPEKWVDPSLSSLENYARTQQPQPPKQKT